MTDNKKRYLKHTRRKLMTNCIKLQAIDEQSDLSNMQILTGVEVSSEAYFPKLPEYCPSAEGMQAIFPQLGEINLTIDRR